MMRDKFLTEAMGECWHEVHRPMDVRQMLCKKCGVRLYGDLQDRPDFSTWDGFGKLKSSRELQKKVGSSKFRGMLHNALEYDDTPDRFADALYEFLKEHK